MKQKTKYPKTAGVVAGVALVLFVAGFQTPAFFAIAGFLGLVALILALGPDKSAGRSVASSVARPQYRGGELVIVGGALTTRSEAGLGTH